MRNQRVGNCHGSIQSTLWRSVCAGWMGLGIGIVGVDLHIVRHLLSSPGDGRGWSAPRRMRHGDRLEGRPFPRLDFLGFIQYQSLLLIEPQHLPLPFFSFNRRATAVAATSAVTPPQLRQARLPPGDCSPNLCPPLCCLLIDHWARGGGERGPWSSGVLDGRRRWQGGCSHFCPRGSHGNSGGRQRGPHGALREGHRRSLACEATYYNGDLVGGALIPKPAANHGANWIPRRVSIIFFFHILFKAGEDFVFVFL